MTDPNLTNATGEAVSISLAWPDPPGPDTRLPAVTDNQGGAWVYEGWSDGRLHYHLQQPVAEAVRHD